MELMRRKFKLNLNCIFDLWESVDGIELCVNELSKLFEIPDDVKVIWLSLHSHPTAERVKLKVVNISNYPKWPNIDYWIPIGDRESLRYYINIGVKFTTKMQKYSHLHLQCEFYEKETK